MFVVSANYKSASSRRWLFAAAMMAAVIVQPAAAQTRASLTTGHLSLRIEGTLNKLAGAPSAEEVALLKDRMSYTWSGEDWDVEGQSLYSYSGVLRTEETHYQWLDEGVYALANRTTYVRSGNESMVELREEWDAQMEAFVPIDRYTYSYTLDPNTGAQILTSTVFEVWIGTGWTNVERTTYTLDANLQIIGAETGMWNGEGWDAFERITFTQEGSDVVQVDQEWNGLAWENAKRSVFRGVTVAQLEQKLRMFLQALEDYGSLNFGFRFLPPYTMQEWDGMEWVNSERLIHEAYNMFTGEVMRMQFQEWDGEEWAGSSALEIDYDTAGRPTVFAVQFFDGEQWSTFMTETFEYDSMGDISVATTQYVFGAGLENVSRTVFTWEHKVVSTDRDPVPGSFRLEAAYPNPFNPSTNISYEVGATGPVALRIYDALGRSVATLFDGVQAAGTHEVAFNAANLPSGQYIVRLEAPGFQQARVVTLLK